MDGDVFGASVGPWAVEQGVLNAIRDVPDGGNAPRLVYYLADQERTTGLAPKTLPLPPGPSSYRGGVDAGTIEYEWCPMVHVIVRPEGEPVMTGPTSYSQRYDLEIVCTAGDDNEDVARMVANTYATAVGKLLVDYPDMGIAATDTGVTMMPDPELLDPVNSRQVCRSTIKLSTLVPLALEATGGPPTWAEDPYAAPGAYPEAETTGLTFTAEQMDQPLT